MSIQEIRQNPFDAGPANVGRSRYVKSSFFVDREYKQLYLVEHDNAVTVFPVLLGPLVYKFPAYSELLNASSSELRGIEILEALSHASIEHLPVCRYEVSVSDPLVELE